MNLLFILCMILGHIKKQIVDTNPKLITEKNLEKLVSVHDLLGQMAREREIYEFEVSFACWDILFSLVNKLSVCGW